MTGPADGLSDRHRTGIQVAVVDDDTVIRSGLPLLLPDITFVGLYRDTEELLLAHPLTDVVLLDLHLQGTGHPSVREGADAVRALTAAGYTVCVHTNERRRHVLVGCLVAGARGIVHKAEPLAAISDSAARTARGEVVITQALVGLAELAERRHALPSLTTRQRQILSARARGESYQSMARRMFIAKKTAEEHWAVITGKFAEFLSQHSPADLERLLGLEPGDLIDWTPPVAGRSASEDPTVQR